MRLGIQNPASYRMVLGRGGTRRSHPRLLTRRTSRIVGHGQGGDVGGQFREGILRSTSLASRVARDPNGDHAVTESVLDHKQFLTGENGLVRKVLLALCKKLNLVLRVRCVRHMSVLSFCSTFDYSINIPQSCNKSSPF